MSEKHILSLQRGMKILEEVAARPDGARLQDLATVIGCSAPAALNLAKTLVALGYLRRQEKPARYFLGGKINELWRMQSGWESVQEIKKSMLLLAKEIPGISICHCVFKGSEVVIERRLDSGSSGALMDGMDYVLPPYTSLASMVHLAFWPEELRSQYIRRHPFDIYGITFWKAPENFEAALEEIRQEGVYHINPEAREGISIGVPVFTAGKCLLASMTLGWRPPQGEEAVDFDKMRKKIAKTAQKIFSATNKY